MVMRLVRLYSVYTQDDLAYEAYGATVQPEIAPFPVCTPGTPQIHAESCCFCEHVESMSLSLCQVCITIQQPLCKQKDLKHVVSGFQFAKVVGKIIYKKISEAPSESFFFLGKP